MPNSRRLQVARLAATAVTPRTCGGCGTARPMAVDSGRAAGVAGSWCGHCRDRWGPTPGRWPTGPGGCPGWAAAAYRGRVRRAILQAKRGAPAAATALLLERLPRGALPSGACVTWVPAHPRRVVGASDSGRTLAEAVARREGLPVRRLLWRTPWARRQAGRTTVERSAAPERLGLRAAGTAPEVVVLVDDVRTTGTTLDHAARLLRRSGASTVIAVTVAAAPEADGPSASTV